MSDTSSRLLKLLSLLRTRPRALPADAAAYVTGKLYSLAPTYRAIATLHAPAAEAARHWAVPQLISPRQASGTRRASTRARPSWRHCAWKRN